jgi:protease PrsW
MVFLALPYAIIPMVFFMIIVRRLDRYDPEPIWLLMTHFLWGALGAVSVSAMLNGKLTEMFWGKLAEGVAAPKMASVLVGPPVEEILKAMVFILTIRLRDFNNLTDGIVYGATVGFGFAMTENLVYFIRYAEVTNLAQLIAYRTFFSGLMHALACGTFGAALGYAQFSLGRVPWFYVIGGFVPAIILHMAFNFLVSTESVSVLGLVLIAIAFAILCGSFIQSLRFEQKYIRDELNKEVEAGLMTAEEVELPFKKRQTKNEYVRAKICVQIAFERHAARFLNERWQKKQSANIITNFYNDLKTSAQ